MRVAIAARRPIERALPHSLPAVRVVLSRFSARARLREPCRAFGQGKTEGTYDGTALLGR